MSPDNFDFNFYEYKRASNEEMKYAMLNLNFKDNYKIAERAFGEVSIRNYLCADDDSKARALLGKILGMGVDEFKKYVDGIPSDGEIKQILASRLAMPIDEIKKEMEGGKNE